MFFSGIRLFLLQQKILLKITINTNLINYYFMYRYYRVSQLIEKKRKSTKFYPVFYIIGILDDVVIYHDDWVMETCQILFIETI